jgi:hypothetical protein
MNFVVWRRPNAGPHSVRTEIHMVLHKTWNGNCIRNIERGASWSSSLEDPDNNYLPIHPTTYLYIHMSLRLFLCQAIHPSAGGYNTGFTQRCTTACGQMIWIPSEAAGCTGTSWGKSTMERLYSMNRFRDRHTLYRTASRMQSTSLTIYNYCLYCIFYTVNKIIII